MDEQLVTTTLKIYFLSISIRLKPCSIGCLSTEKRSHTENINDNRMLIAKCTGVIGLDRASINMHRIPSFKCHSIPRIQLV